MSEVSAARQLAFGAIRATFEDGAFTEAAFRQAAAGPPPLRGRERAQAQRLTYGAVQRRGSTDAAIERLTERPIRQLDPCVLAGLRLGLYELLFADGTPDHAAVDQAVELVKRGGGAHARGLVNAVLRRAAREREALSANLFADDSTPEAAAIAHSAPLWLAQMWWHELGPASARALLRSCNEPAEVAMRVSPPPPQVPAAIAAGTSFARRAEAAAGRALEALGAAGVRAAAAAGGWPLASPESIVLAGRMGDSVAAMVAAGRLTPQSRGSAAVVEVLDPRDGEHLLDLCAGPGIKSGQIAARMGDRGELISVEPDPERAAQVAAQAERLGLRSITVVEAKAAPIEIAADFDRVLVDAPCSDLGALASRPDARWRKSPALIERLAAVQQRALRGAARVLRPGGVMVYATCTISRRENEDQIAALLGAASEGTVPPLEVCDLSARAPRLASGLDRRCLQLRPDRDRTTGFFICRLRRHDGGL